MKRIVTFLFVLMACCYMYGQDVITKLNGDTMTVKILEVGIDNVRYVMLSSLDGPEFIISKRDIFMITYRNGTKEVFTEYRERNNIAEPHTDITPGMKYSRLKNIYDYRDYRAFLGREKYSPVLAGICSALIPGLGQLVCGEAGRSLVQFSVALGVTCIANGIYNNSVDRSYYPYDSYVISNASASLAAVLYLGVFVWDIYSIVDAVRVAKVKNMYNVDLNKLSQNLKIMPFMDLSSLNNRTSTSAGLTFSLSF